MEILGGIAKLRVAAAELRAFSRWSHAFAEQRAQRCAVRTLGRLPDDRRHQPAHLGHRWACSALPPAATIPSMSPRSPPSTAPSASSPRRSSASPRAQRVDRGGAAVRPHPPGVRGAARGRGKPRRSRPPRRAASPFATCRSVMPTTGRGSSTTSISRLARARASPSSAPRARASRRCCACCSASRRRRAAASTTTARTSRPSTSRLVRRQIGTVLETAGLVPGSTLREHRRQRAAHARAGHGSGAPGRPRRRHRGHADGARDLRHGRRQPALGRPAPARDDRPRAGPPAAADLLRRGDQRPRQPHPGDRGRRASRR